MSTEPFHEKLMSISSLTSKMLRKNFGRGPDSCFAFANGPYLVLYIRRFLSPMESVLLESGNSDKIDMSRTIVMDKILTQLKGMLEIEFGADVKSAYHDWNYNQNTGMITIEFESNVTGAVAKSEENPIFKNLIDEVDRISIIVQKKPENTEAFFITPRVYLVKRKGILVEIEKSLIDKGYEQTLLVTKDELEKSFLHHNGHFEEIFSHPVADIFVDWNLHDDNSIICFILKN
ncbi:Na-translocating system protein MpsC family protein [Robertmurraya sp. P23]|uniref:Na-translocating system protein MpsC family protein n=1 Tax=Robertmurraya sp. P23 TaxID=3436931 RepID=UPI003D99C297